MNIKPARGKFGLPEMRRAFEDTVSGFRRVEARRIFYAVIELRTTAVTGAEYQGDAAWVRPWQVGRKSF